MKKITSAVMAVVLAGSVGWAEDEDSDTVVNAISSGSGVNYKVGVLVCEGVLVCVGVVV